MIFECTSHRREYQKLSNFLLNYLVESTRNYSVKNSLFAFNYKEMINSLPFIEV